MTQFLHAIGASLDYTRELIIIALIFARTMPMIMQTPYIGGPLVPAQVKMTLAVLFTVLLWPLAREALVGPLPVAPVVVTLLLFKEIFIGLAIGYVNAHVFWAMEIAGRITDTARMASMSEVMEPHSEQRTTPFGDMYQQIMVLIFMAVGGHHIFLRAFFFSFVSIPVNKGLEMGGAMTPFFEATMRLGGHIFLIGVTLAAPIFAATLITDVVFGILNRVAPQLNAYFMSMPVKALGGMVIALLVMNTVIARFYDFVTWSLEAVEKTISLFAVSG